MSQAIKSLSLTNVDIPRVSESQWIQMFEFEAVLSITALTTKLAQSEKHFLGAYRCLILGLTLNALRSEKSTVAHSGSS
jgi:hypothetical protein